jgi:hypothetical protein
MKSLRHFSNQANYGYSVIILLVVVVIIMIVLLTGPFKSDPVTGITQAQNQIDRSADAACGMNRGTIKTYVTTYQLYNPGAAPTLGMLAKVNGNLPQCPRGGIYLIGQDGTVYCTKHAPPPAQELERLMKQIPATPTPLALQLALTPLPAAPPPTPIPPDR